MCLLMEVRLHRILGSSPGRVTGRFALHSLHTLTVVGDASFVALPCGSVDYIIAAATGVLIETSAPAQGIVAVAAAQVIPAAAARTAPRPGAPPPPPVTTLVSALSSPTSSDVPLSAPGQGGNAPRTAAT